MDQAAVPVYRSRRVMIPVVAFVVGAIATIVVVSTTTGVFDSHASAPVQDTSSRTEAPSSFTAIGGNTTTFDVTTTTPNATAKSIGDASNLGATSTPVDPNAPTTSNQNTGPNMTTSELASGGDSMGASESSSGDGSERWDSSASSSSAAFDSDDIEPPAGSESNTTLSASVHTNDGNAAAVQGKLIQAKLSQRLHQLRAQQKQLQRQIQLVQRRKQSHQRTSTKPTRFQSTMSGGVSVNPTKQDLPTSVSGLHSSIASTTAYNQQLEAQLVALAASRSNPK
ncbi:hypothetical protein SDRG_07400 [Saprolegnia diclina VS20]|uniref:Uncharacterized protein n=1 Tax=Saprolegnia diclina (strain VS20) TaxID=1156394 RepID=T0RRP8_SAPDV|nr:hypothetical protein SDRG_07400 [Saprolegnia diclina VS20]EQC35168.1 hypothetical protein SDRG_07400 [Saprolegnia diclina VS20]|eukprot:XP_008611452.1 hypothetical protein SDRG_07400 [Saprolegnia diclina VS20]